MIHFARDFRLIPIVLLATISLFALKVSGLVFDGGYTLGERLAGAHRTDMTITTRESIPEVTPIIIADRQPAAKQPWAREMFNFGDVTGSVEAAKPADPPPKATQDPQQKVAQNPGEPPQKDAPKPKPVDPPKSPDGTVVPADPAALAPAGERAILERLHNRRQELDARGHELEMRESLLKAAEKRLESQVIELKGVETRVSTAVQTRDKAEVQRFKDIVSMYENMKGKDAARIFDRLDLKILVEVATQINPRKMSEILALMTVDSAERLTVELANRATADKGPQSADKLPKIEGKPNGS
jgi:flagellar motility protein MotE (MotC chaperone)